MISIGPTTSKPASKVAFDAYVPDPSKPVTSRHVRGGRCTGGIDLAASLNPRALRLLSNSSARRYTCRTHTTSIPDLPDTMRNHHDMGGLPADRVEATEHDYALWEKRVDALMVLLSGAGRMTVDELRKNIELIGPDAYDSMTYYERWIHSISQTLIQRGVITIDELGRKMAEVEVRHKGRSR